MGGWSQKSQNELESALKDRKSTCRIRSGEEGVGERSQPSRENKCMSRRDYAKDEAENGGRVWCVIKTCKKNENINLTEDWPTRFCINAGERT